MSLGEQKQPVVLEDWDGKDGLVNVYTELPQVYALLIKKFKRVAVYEKHGKVVGWQFAVPKAEVEGIKLTLASTKLSTAVAEKITEDNFLEKWEESKNLRKSEG